MVAVKRMRRHDVKRLGEWRRFLHLENQLIDGQRSEKQMPEVDRSETSQAECP
jgi:hypothetical protein